MTDKTTTPTIAIVGPTATGKSDLADSLAAHFDSEIISADSMQIYTMMDIGTAKTAPSKRSVTYRCIDLVNPGEPYSVAQYQHEARSHIERLLGEGRVPVVCGGTGLYVRAALDAGFEFGEDGAGVMSDARAKYESLAETLGPDRFHALLAEKDPESAALIHPNNVRRVVRAFEMLDAGERYVDHAARFSEREFQYPPTHLFALSYPRDVLYQRCNKRVIAMIEAGLVQEVEQLLDKGFREGVTAQQAIGYKELVGVIEGTKSLDEAIAEIQQNTRRYAKRQLTWFRADPRITWIDTTGKSPQALFDEVLESL